MTSLPEPLPATVGDTLVSGLLAQEVDTLFAIPGVQIDYLFNAIHDVRGAIRVFTPRHEQGAAYMATGYAVSSGRVGAFAAVPGPGWLNTTAALATAWGLNAPVLSIAGQIPLASIGRGIGEVHELPDQLGVAARLTKWAARVERAEDVAPLIEQAFTALRSGRPRPVHLEIPQDVLAKRGDARRACSVSVDPKAASDDEALESAERLLRGARRPIVFVGGGAQGASEEVRRLAERLRAPVTALRRGLGVLDERHACWLPWPAAYRTWATADVVLAVGTRLDFPRRMWGMDPAMRIIRIDVDAEEFDRISRPDVCLLGDARLSLRDLLARLGDAAPADDSRLESIADARMACMAQLTEQLAPQCAWLQAIRRQLPEDGILVDEMTQVGYAAWTCFPVYRPRTFVTAGYQTTLGYGYATALGVQVANPGRQVVSINGDGGFMFGASELATAAKYGLGVVAIVFVDGRFGNVFRIQRDRYGGKVLGSNLHNPDFVKLASSFGVRACRVTAPNELERELAAAFAAGGPALIEVPVGEMPNPWQAVVFPRVRGA